ncbi:hypothetical protein IW138_003955 [Coemansia sp. RSA 986]|nr:hypothetical protein IW138_003955 [Coemansia sp. RSA 986]
MRGAQHYRYETSPPPSTLIWALYSGFTSFLAIVIVGVIDKYGAAIKNHHLPFAIAPAGASSVLIFGVPSSPLGQPRNMIVGHMIAAVIGTFMRELFKHASESFDWMPCALAVGISIGLMGLTNCYHPPAGATAFMAGYSSHTIKRVGWWFPLFPVLSLTLVLLVLGILFNNLARVYPVYWFTAAHFTYQNAHDRKAMAEATEDNGGSDRTMAEETSGANSTTSSLDIFLRRLGGDPGGNLTRHPPAKRIELKAAGTSADTIRDTLRAEVRGPADKANKCVEHGKIVEAELDAHIYEQVKDLQPVFYIYENDAPSKKDLYYDIKCDPIKHIKTLVVLARFFQKNKFRSFQCMSLCTQWIPCHLTNDLSGEVLDINCQAIKSKQGGKMFEDSVQTDGVSISIFKKCKAKKKTNNSTDQTSDTKISDSASTLKTKTPKTKNGKEKGEFEFEYIESIDQAKPCAMGAPLGNPWLFRFTRNHKAKLTCSTKFRRILEAAKKMYPDNAIIEAEQVLSEVSCTTVDPDEFKRFVEVQDEVWLLLSKFYFCMQTNSTMNKKPARDTKRPASGSTKPRIKLCSATSQQQS